MKTIWVLILYFHTGGPILIEMADHGVCLIAGKIAETEFISLADWYCIDTGKPAP